jgi:hypothetical protein
MGEIPGKQATWCVRDAGRVAPYDEPASDRALGESQRYSASKFFGEKVARQGVAPRVAPYDHPVTSGQVATFKSLCWWSWSASKLLGGKVAQQVDAACFYLSPCFRLKEASEQAFD